MASSELASSDLFGDPGFVGAGSNRTGFVWSDPFGDSDFFGCWIQLNWLHLV